MAGIARYEVGKTCVACLAGTASVTIDETTAKSGRVTLPTETTAVRDIIPSSKSDGTGAASEIEI